MQNPTRNQVFHLANDEEYMKKRTKERMSQNIIKWWNVKDLGTKNYIGSPELEDPLYGCPVYAPHTESVSEELLKMDHIEETDYRDPITDITDQTASNAPNADVDDEALRIANEIYERLQREAEADAQKKEDEIAAAKLAQEDDSAFNASTGSYSGLYGQTPMSDAEKDAFAAIMAQNGNISDSASALFNND